MGVNGPLEEKMTDEQQAYSSTSRPRERDISSMYSSNMNNVISVKGGLAGEEGGGIRTDVRSQLPIPLCDTLNLSIHIILQIQNLQRIIAISPDLRISPSEDSPFVQSLQFPLVSYRPPP